MFHNRTLERLNEMLDAGIAGTFEEADYDESKLSRLESKWKHYIAQSALSKANLDRERENIKGLVSDISHQTKTPMTNIRMYSELLAERMQTGEDAEGERIVKEILHQTEKLDFLIGCLTKISRLESNIVTVEPKKQEIYPLLKSTVDMMEVKATAKNIRLIYDESESALAYFDLKWTKEALENIVDNAIKYSPRGSEIQISLEVYEMYVAILVRDVGIGIAEEEIPKIFGRFYRGKSVHDDEGVGIGLFLAREIVSREDGYIKVRSKLGTGSTFSIYLKRN